MRINVGCGEDHLDGYVNIDLRGDVADTVADARKLPYEPNTVDEVRAFDVLEHFPADQTATVLAEWRRVLVPGGTLNLRVPNMLALARKIVDDRGVVLIIRNIYGGHRWGPEGSWDAHHTGWTPSMLNDALNDNGFYVLDNDYALNMAVMARKVA